MFRTVARRRLCHPRHVALSDLEIIQRAADELPAGVWIARAPRGELVYANQAFREIMGMEARSDVARGEYAAPYGIHTRTGALYPEGSMPFVRALAERAPVVVDDLVIHRPDGGRVYVRAHARPVFLEGSETISHVVIAFFDTSREVELERQRAEAEAGLARAQRMESIGNLAGGIAHDFNNLLSVVRLLAASLRRNERDSMKLDDLRRIDEVVDSAAGLTRALLAFAGRGPSRAERVSVSSLARSMLDIVSRAVDRRIAVEGELATGCDVIGDSAQIEQIVMNLLVNARDAVTDTGRIQLAVYASEVDADLASRFRRLAPGPHIVIEVRDDGSGIDPAIRDRVFEPYFTTKTAGPVRGTGLGLSTVFGIVEAHAGAIELVGDVPRGTVARVWLPAAPPSPPEAVISRAAVSLGRGGTVLLVEDEPLVRDTAVRELRQLGYDVLVAVDGVEAVEVFRASHRIVDAVVLDMIMPRMGGRATFRALRDIDPGVQVVLTTGYARNDESISILDLGARVLVEKPYRIETLDAALREILDARTSGSSNEGESI
jgi:two-component system cell cycle sensor histidine kinase/response regulator CckA